MLPPLEHCVIKGVDTLPLSHTHTLSKSGSQQGGSLWGLRGWVHLLSLESHCVPHAHATGGKDFPRTGRAHGRGKRPAPYPAPLPPSASLRMNPGDKGDRELRRRDRRDRQPSSSELSRAHLGLGAALGLQVASLPTSSPSSSCACLCPNLLGTAATLDQGPLQRPRVILTTCLKAQSPNAVTW